MDGLVTVLWILFGITAGVSLAYLFFVYKRKTIIQNDVEIVMSQLKSVSKLVTVEGDFSEIYQHKDKTPLLFNWFSSEKKAIIIIKSKVMMGYDLSEMKYDVNTVTKTIHIDQKPAPKILSLHMDAEYFDVKNGTFNRFNKEELERVKEEAKQFMLDKIEHSDLPKMVEEQSQKGLELLNNTTQALGWKLLS